MTKQGDINYLKAIGENGMKHAAGKPFSDSSCTGLPCEISALMSLLPPPSARLLDFGCGTGWTICFFAKRGYDVVGIDISKDMILCARENKKKEKLENVRFIVEDFENMNFSEEFDCAVFFDSLHHSLDELIFIFNANLPQICFF